MGLEACESVAARASLRAGLSTGTSIFEEHNPNPEPRTSSSSTYTHLKGCPSRRMVRMAQFVIATDIVPGLAPLSLTVSGPRDGAIPDAAAGRLMRRDGWTETKTHRLV